MSNDTNPINPVMDVPSEDIGMNFDQYADVLTNFLVAADPPQLTIGIFGGYGTGKTTLMDAIDKKLPSIHKKNNKPITSVWFNAWRHDKEEHLFLPFLASINRKLPKDDPSLKKKFMAASMAFIRNSSFELNAGFIKQSFNAEKMIKAEEDYLKNNIERQLDGYQDVYEILKGITCDNNELQHNIIVFIDDLDRCLPDKAFALVEALKSYMDIKGFMFVIGLDPRVIESYITKKYGDDYCIDAEEYLQKIIQVPFYLPKVTGEEIQKELEKIFTSDFDLISSIKEPLLKLYNFFPRNIRQIKRLLNMYQSINQAMIYNTSDDDFEPETLLSLLILQLRWPIVYWIYQDSREEFDSFITEIRDLESDQGIDTKWNKYQNTIQSIKNDKDFHDFFENVMYSSMRFSVAEKHLRYLGWPINIETMFMRI